MARPTKRIELPNGCSCTGIPGNPQKGIPDQLNVNPRDWQEKSAPMDRDWYISYRFHDPLNVDKYPEGRLVPVQGMNEHKDWASRKEATALIMEIELDKLKNKGYNPITREAVAPDLDLDYEIDPSTPMATALLKAQTKLKCDKHTKNEIAIKLNVMIEAAKKLRLVSLPINMVSKRHLKRILEYLEENRPNFNAPSYNHYRSYLIMLFSELSDMETIGANPAKELKKRKQVKKIRETVDKALRTRILKYLKETDPPFARFVEIFYHSGARISELMSLQVKDVQLHNNRYIVTVKKGDQPEEVFKTIKNIALPLWKEQMTGARATDYIFSSNMLPGERRLQRREASDRWKEVKNYFGITADLYSLKHSNSTEMKKKYGSEIPAKLNNHKTTHMLDTVYDVDREINMHETILHADNTFAYEEA